MVRPIDGVFLRGYVRTVVATAAQFTRYYLAQLGPFVALLALIGCVGLLRKDRRWLFALIVPTALYAITVTGSATPTTVSWCRRFPQPICWSDRIGAHPTSPPALAGGGLLASDRCPCLDVPGLLEHSPTRYYWDDAAWAAGYARMRSLVADLNQRERDVVLSYSITLDGGMETVYWHDFPLVYGRELPLDAVRKATRNFDRAVCLGGHGHHRPGRATFASARVPGQ